MTDARDPHRRPGAQDSRRPRIPPASGSCHEHRRRAPAARHGELCDRRAPRASTRCAAPQERPVGRIRTRRPVAVDRAPVRRTLESLWLAMGRSVATSPGDPGDRLLSRHSSSRADADRGFKGGTPRTPCLLCAEVMLPHRASCEYRVCHHSALSGFPGRIPARRAVAPRAATGPPAPPAPVRRARSAPPRTRGAAPAPWRGHASGPSGSKGPRALPRARAGATRSPADTAMTRRPAARTRVRPAEDGAARRALPRPCARAPTGSSRSRPRPGGASLRP